MTIVVIDLETTGLDPVKGDSVVELAMVPLTPMDHGHWTVRQGSSSLVAPGRRIPPEAQAVHHIRDEDLRAAPHLREAIHTTAFNAGLHYAKISAIAAHNAEFDRGFVGPALDAHSAAAFVPAGKDPPLKWLCTYRCALHLWPDAPGHSNQTLRYWLPGVDAMVRALIPKDAPAHRALLDATTTACILHTMLEQVATLGGLTHLLALQHKPVLQKIVRFGKHRGIPWSEAPKDYLRWLTHPDRQPPFSDDVLYTARHYLKG